MSFKLKLLSFIADPNLAYLLMMLAALGIYLELSHPGMVLPGVVGGLAAILAMMSFQMLPITTAGIILVLLGLALIGIEFFVAGHGILAGGGTISLMLGGIFLVDPARTDLRVAYSTLFSVGMIFGSIVVLIAYFVLAVRRKPVQTGYDAMIGVRAEVLSYDRVQKQGKLAVRGEIWSFTSDAENIDVTKGDKVIITGREGMIFKVKK